MKCCHAGRENEIITSEMFVNNKKTRWKRDLQGRTERTLAMRTLSDAFFVDIETGGD